MLQKIWKEVHKTTSSKKAPAVCYEDLSFVQRVLRDITDEEVGKIIVDSKDVYHEVDKFTGKYLPFLKGRLEQYKDDAPLFEKHGVDMEIERALSNRVFLRSGGSLNDQTEALVSIDVNTGKFVAEKHSKKRFFEQT